MRILAGLSGGVDSTIAALTLLEQGHDVTGAHLLLWGGKKEGSSCSTSDEQPAREAADFLNIDFKSIDLTHQFQNMVVEPAVEAMRTGSMVNPCTTCNKEFKFDYLISYALENGFDAVATGHYAQTKTYQNTHLIARGTDLAKDQSYFLAQATPAQVSKLVFPLGKLTKTQVRSIAERHSVPAAHTPDSADLCFPLKKLAAQQLGSTPAEVINPEGDILGVVPDIYSVVPGQRRGLKATDPTRPSLPLYVVGKDLEASSVTVASYPEALVSTQNYSSISLNVPFPKDKPCLVQTSAHGLTHPGVLTPLGVQWQKPCLPMAPGQLMVFYIENMIAGYAVAS